MLRPEPKHYRSVGAAWLLGTIAVPAVSLFGTMPAFAESKLMVNLLAPMAVPIAESATPKMGYEPLGIDLTPTIALKPRMTVSGYYDDNVFRTTRGPKGDELATVEGEINIDTDPTRNPSGLYLRFKSARFQKFKSEDYEEFTIGGQTTLEVTDRVKVAIAGGSERLLEERGSAETVRDGTGAVHYGRNRLTADALMSGASLFGYQSITYDDYSYGQSGGVDNRDRDRTEILSRTRIGYELSDASIAFVQGDFNQRDYRRLSFDGFNRSSHGYRVMAGLHYEITDLSFLDLSAGWLQQSYTDRRFAQVSGPALVASLGWRPTDLLALSLTGERRIDESDDATLSGILTTAINFRADFDLADSWNLGLSGSFLKSDFNPIASSIGRTSDRTYQYGIDTRYLFTSHLYGYLGWSAIRRQSTRPGLSFDANRFMIGVSTQW